MITTGVTVGLAEKIIDDTCRFRTVFSLFSVFRHFILFNKKFMNNSFSSVPGRLSSDERRGGCNGEMRLSAFVRELPGRLNFLSVNPNVQSVLLHDHAMHLSVHGQDPGLHDLALLFHEGLVRFAVYF